jgi:hypothetical protein
MDAQALEAAMASDFSIKQIGSPVAAPLSPLVSAAAEDAIATELPARQSVLAADTSARVRNDPESAADTSKHVMFDRNAGAIVYEVVDNRTSLVVRQFPDQQFLRRRAYARALEQAREDALALKVDRKI